MPDTTGYFTLRVQGANELQRLAADLKKAGRGDLMRRLRRNIRRAARPVEADLRVAVMAVRVTSSRGGTARPDVSTGLRRRIAGAITTSVTAKGVRITVSARRVGPYGTTLPKYLDASITIYRRWRVRVFGHDVWVTQYGQPWWFVTILSHAPAIRQAVLDALDETARELAG